MLAPALLALSLAALAWFQRRDVRTFRRFRALEDTARRQRVFLRWARNACLMYLGVPLLGLALLGRLDALWRFPAEFAAVRIEVPELCDPGFLAGMVGAILVGGTIGGLLAARRRTPAKPPAALDITPMLPRNRAELVRLFPLVLNAGVSEEIFFRLYLPLLLVGSGASAALAFGATAIGFGLLHRYQGWLGVLLTTVLSGAFLFLYLATASLVAPIAFHLLINANALLLRPGIKLAAARRLTPLGG
jgi:uncharacterized protein